ncbi:MAG TPA: hypothetical protein VFS48_03910 [Solirubrobacterales bacterium]|nr:hypothetical protein [Solirubrobacterales bacterium]
MKQGLSRVSIRGVIALAVGLTATFALAPALASGASDLGSANTVYMKADKAGLRFEAPKTIFAGEELEVLNQSNPKQVGPHTFSLVTKGSLPKTQKARQTCFTPQHICMAIAKWHGVKGNGPVKVNPVEVGLEGWDTMGSVSKKGDSWFTGSKPGTSITQKVTAAPGSKLYFLCAIHPWMQGSTEVLAPPTPAPLPTS